MTEEKKAAGQSITIRVTEGDDEVFGELFKAIHSSIQRHFSEDELPVKYQVIFSGDVRKPGLGVDDYKKSEGREMSNEQSAGEFLKSAIGVGRIVSSDDLNEFQIAEARVTGRWYVDDDGYGYAVLPWDLTTAKDKARDEG